MRESNAVPVAPDPALLGEFNARFTESAQINNVIDDASSTGLFPMEEVVSLRIRDAKAGRIKVGHGVVHVQDFFIRYSHAMLAKLGIRRWAPDLEGPIDSLWNKAC